MPHAYEYPRGAFTVDCFVFGLDDEELKVMLIQLALSLAKDIETEEEAREIAGDLG